MAEIVSATRAVLKTRRREADPLEMGCSVIGLLAFLGATLGSFAPELWGGSAISLASVLFGALGGVAGVWLGARLSDA